MQIRSKRFICRVYDVKLTIYNYPIIDSFQRIFQNCQHTKLREIERVRNTDIIKIVNSIYYIVSR